MTTTPEALTPEERDWLNDAHEPQVQKLLRIHDQQAAALEQAHRFAALCILTHWDAEGGGGPPEESWPPRVKELVEQYGHGEMDRCTRCAAWAPVTKRAYPDSMQVVCQPGWGCSAG